MFTELNRARCRAVDVQETPRHEANHLGFKRVMLRPLLILMVLLNPAAAYPTPSDDAAEPVSTTNQTPSESPIESAEETTSPGPVQEQAQDRTASATPPNGQAPAPDITDDITPPQLIKHQEPAYPSALQARGVLEGSVTVMVTVNVGGRITEHHVESSDDPAFTAALVKALPYWSFQPATQGDTPVEIRMRLKWDFKADPLPTPLAPAPEDTLGQVDGRVFSRGIRRPVAGLVIRFEPGNYEAFTEKDGHFVLEAPPGTYKAYIEDPAFRPFTETLEVEKKPTRLGEWLITPVGLDDNSVVVVGRRTRSTQRITLDRFELSHVPGTMGDPLRVIQSLPGVGSVASFIPFPIVRGAPPGDTGYFVDETSLPMLFHLGVGTSVIHPQLIDQVHFYPGVAPVQYGRFVGGAVEATTRVSEKDLWIGDIDINLFQTGVMVSAPFNEGRTRLTAGGRYSYTGLLLTLLSQDAYLNFWDYNVRLDQRFQNEHQLRLSVFGAQDELGDGRDEANRIFVDFHRATGRYVIPHGKHRYTLGIDLGADRVDTPAERAEDDSIQEQNGIPADDNERAAVLREYSIRPLARWQVEVNDIVEIETGADLEIRPAASATSGDDDDDGVADPSNFISPPDTKFVYGLFSAVTLELDRWILVPSLRVDYYENVDKLGIDPRFGVRYKVNDSTTLKGHLGLAHAQQRFFVPIPGLGDLELESPLQEAWQSTVGIEHDFGGGYSIDASIYFAYRRHMLATVFDSFDDEDDEDDEEDKEDEENKEDDSDGGMGTFELPVQNGRAFGAELILRKRRTAKVFGWLAYTLQRIERKLGNEWVIDPLDQTHIANLVVSWRFLPDYIAGVRLHYNSGRPIRETNRRLPGFFQVDARLDILSVADNYQIDFYIDFINLTFAGEKLSEDGEAVKFILPTIGAHGTF